MSMLSAGWPAERNAPAAHCAFSLLTVFVLRSCRSSLEALFTTRFSV